jgi:hypothetical protein
MILFNLDPNHMERHVVCTLPSLLAYYLAEVIRSLSGYDSTNTAPHLKLDTPAQTKGGSRNRVVSLVDEV